MKDTIAWYRDNEAWWRPLLDRAPVQETAWKEHAESVTRRS
jgi:dTDP-glucose 4,6-dehydratase